MGMGTVRHSPYPVLGHFTRRRVMQVRMRKAVNRSLRQSDGTYWMFIAVELGTVEEPPLHIVQVPRLSGHPRNFILLQLAQYSNPARAYRSSAKLFAITLRVEQFFVPPSTP